jgi:hypothetical protein
MKRIVTQIFLGLLGAAGVRADVSLTINSATPFGCLQNAFIFQPPLSVTGNFSLPDVSGTGVVHSGINASAPSFGYPPEIYFYNYTLDLSGLPAAANHCVKLLVHFGSPQGCDVNEVWGSPSQIYSATLAPFGDITFVFAGGCLAPSQPAVTFTMFSEAPPKTNIVTVIDRYVDPSNGTTNETRINVQAIVPDIPPDPPFWLYWYPAKIPYVSFQGFLDTSTNEIPMKTNVTGAFDFTLQLVTAPSNGLAASEIVTQTVQVANGVFTVPLAFNPSGMGGGAERWLNIGVRPSNLPAVQFTPIGPPLPLTPAPQALYAYTAGSVADLAPGQAVTSLNGLTDAVQLQPGNTQSIFIGTNGNTLTLDVRPGTVSDRNRKTDFTVLRPEEILAKLATLPIEGWRYTNEVAGVRHVGPMAQDFKAAFGLGQDEKFIEFVDEEGVALAAIQGLNEKLEDRSKKLETENAELKARLGELEKLLNPKGTSR